MKSFKHALSFGLTAILAYCSACSPPDSAENARTKDAPQAPRAAAVQSGPTTVSLAPFDRYPADKRFPLVFRFSAPVAPSDRTARENFEKVTVYPERPGTWQWTSDSDLSFLPNDGWRPEEAIRISLAGLVTSDGTQGTQVKFTPENFQIITPAPTAALARCELTISNRAPLIQKTAVTVRFNYPVGWKDIAPYKELILKRGATVERIALDYSLTRNDMQLDFTGPELFRPEQAGALEFLLREGLPIGPGRSLTAPVKCELPIAPETWDELAEKLKDPPKVKPTVILSISAPTRAVGEIENTRSPLTIRFKDAWNSQQYPHGKAKGLSLEHGLKLSVENDPSTVIPGIWKTSETDERAIDFIPASEWPIGQWVKVEADPQIFPDVQFKNAAATFSTPLLTARFDYPTLYTDPQNPQIRKVVSAVAFSHLVDIDPAAQKLRMDFRIEPAKHFSDPRVKSLKFTIKPDEKSPWRIFIESEALTLPDEPGEVRILLGDGLIARNGGRPTSSELTTNLKIPSIHQIFTIGSAAVSVVKRDDDRLERVLTVDVSEPVSGEDLQSALELYVLPDCKLEENRKLCRENEQLGDQALVYPEILAKAERVGTSLIPRDEAAHPNLFHFAFEAPGARELFVLIKKDFASLTKFKLSRDFRSVLYATIFPKQLKVMHQGALLSVSGSRKLGISARNMREVEFELARILPANVHHLLSVTYGTFAKPEFNYGSIKLDQLAERVSYVEALPDKGPGETIYTTIDFNRFLKGGAPPQGLFMLTVREKQPKKKSEAEEPVEQQCEGEDCYVEESSEPACEAVEEGACSTEPKEDRRLVLLTDLGLLVKDGLSGDHEVFAMSFKSGAPVAGATVKLLGQNGQPVFTRTTDQTGRVGFPPTKDLTREKIPLLYVVENGSDYSFLPFARNDRQLNFSRFDTGGVVNSEEAEGLRALIFSDRGIYRPGEEARFGIIVRRRNLELAGVNLPLELSLTDPRGVEILKRKFTLSRLGFEDFRWTSENALTGTYGIGVYLVRGKKEEKRRLLGSTSFRVDEFQPDKLAVKTRFKSVSAPQAPLPAGWSGRGGDFEVSVQNLFGTPAVDNKVAGTLLLNAWNGSLPGYPDYDFYHREGEVQLPADPENLGEKNTDAAGLVDFSPDLARFAERAFQVEFAAEAFEKDSGRSVVATTSALVSDAQSFLGWKADGDLGYINKGGGRKLTLVAVGPDLKPVKLDGLKLELIETKQLSTLVKQPNGTLRYEMTPKRSSIWTGSLNVEPATTEFMLNTANAGDYTLNITAADGTALNSVHYVVHGEGNTAFMADRKAEVGIKLSRTSVEPDEVLELSINTPYTGAGLITIEREKVYAAQWFKTDTLSSVQTIRVPRGVVGNAYVSVAFVRGLDSKDIFASPLSYGVEPFSIAKSEYTESIQLTVPEKTKPGTDLAVHYKILNPGKFLLYAIDEGILQFARYRNPEPIGQFIPKRALEVQTFQILDLLLPDQRIVDSLSAPGGDEDVGLGKFKNPFARKRRAPMAFWSGILPEGSREGDIKIPVPEYFNGALRILAVAVTEKRIGVETSKAVSQADFVIDPQAPYFVSPGDEFEVGATVANTVAGSGSLAQLTAEVLTETGFDLADTKPVDLVVPEGQDKVFRLRLKAKDILGEQTFRIKVKGLGREVTASESISIRPPQAYRTSLSAGVYRPDKDGAKPEKSLDVKRDLYSELRDVSASVSMTPLTVGRALMSYLKTYPYSCTEQLLSAAFPAVLFGPNPEMGLSEKDVERFNKRAFQALSSRQRADGSFGLWDAYSEPDRIFSVYGAHYLLEADARGVEIPNTVWERSLTWLESLAQNTEYDAFNQFAQAYALYLRARAGQVVTKDLDALAANLDRQWNDKWRETAISVFLAGAYQLMQMDQKAQELLKRPPQVWSPKLTWPANNAVLYGSIYSWIAAKHFPESTWMSPLDAVLPVAQMIEDQDFNTFSASFAVMALDAISEKLAESHGETLKISTADAQNALTPLQLTGTRVFQAAVPELAKRLAYEGPSGKFFFYELSETGFDRKPAEPIAAGLEIAREVKNEAGNLQSEFTLQEKPEVTLLIKAETPLSRMAVLELVPGGFEIDLSEEGLAQRKSLKPGPNTWNPSFIEIQEDRVIFFGDLPQDTATFTYRLKPLSRGKFTFAAPYAEGMYDMKKRFLGAPSSIVVK